MNKYIFIILAMVIMFGVTADVQADGCFICENGQYVKYRDEETESKKREAAACGCSVVGTISPCKVKDSKVICTVMNQSVKTEKLAKLTIQTQSKNPIKSK